MVTLTVGAPTTGARLEHVGCVLCGADEPRPLVRLKRDRYLRALGISPPESRKVMCGRCGHIYQNPQLTDAEISRLYRDVYRSSALGYADDRPGAEYLYWKRLKARRDHEWIRAHVPATAGSALEIGCAEGSLLSLLAKDGWRVVGVEATPSYCDYAREVLGLDVIAAAFEDAELGDRRFDLVIALKVLEHSKHPMEFLARTRDVLSPGGCLVVTVPNALRPDQDLSTFLASPHISLFTPASLTAMLGAAGLDTVHIDDTQQFVAAVARPAAVVAPPRIAAELAYHAIRRAIRRERGAAAVRGSVRAARRALTGTVKRTLRVALGAQQADRVWARVRGFTGRPARPTAVD